MQACDQDDINGAARLGAPGHMTHHLTREMQATT